MAADDGGGTGQRVSADDVRHVAMLARLGVTDGRATELARDLNTILEHMAVLSRVDTGDADQTAHVSAGTPLRDDKGPPIPLAEPPSSFAPEMDDGFFLVPRLATHEEVDLES